MNDSPSNSIDGVAVNFVETELANARGSLRRTRFWTVASILFVLSYMTFVAVTLHVRLLRPKPAVQ